MNETFYYVDEFNQDHFCFIQRGSRGHCEIYLLTVLLLRKQKKKNGMCSAEESPCRQHLVESLVESPPRLALVAPTGAARRRRQQQRHRFRVLFIST